MDEAKQQAVKEMTLEELAEFQRHLNGDLLQYLANDEGNAQRLIAVHGTVVRYCHDFRKWLVWDGRRWAIDTTEQVKRLTKQAILGFLNQAIDQKDGKAEKFAKESLDDRRINA